MIKHNQNIETSIKYITNVQLRELQLKNMAINSFSIVMLL